MDLTPPRRTYVSTQQQPARPPRYEKLAPFKRHRTHWNFWLVIIAVTGLAGAIIAFGTMRGQQQVSPVATQPDQAQADARITQESPPFNALTPGNAKVTWSRLTPPNSDSYYAYSSALQGATIRVSEQPLPSGLKDNTGEQVAELAKAYNANHIIDVSGITVYIGTNTKGQQSLLFTTRSLLIMITTDTTLNDRQWSDYIRSLE